MSSDTALKALYAILPLKFRFFLEPLFNLTVELVANMVSEHVFQWKEKSDL